MYRKRQNTDLSVLFSIYTRRCKTVEKGCRKVQSFRGDPCKAFSPSLARPLPCPHNSHTQSSSLSQGPPQPLPRLQISPTDDLVSVAERNWSYQEESSASCFLSDKHQGLVSLLLSNLRSWKCPLVFFQASPCSCDLSHICSPFSRTKTLFHSGSHFCYIFMCSSFPAPCAWPANILDPFLG